ncbi:ATP-dependent protease ATPase subunit HslU [Aureibacillus halotolerans]|uniref:ATP-dependent protease ATPase subunit HslU n=1 Tax=Aureibacillus halotolerans TaxID=1508390 RepID=A0A4R6U069_9BACI|nr:ATP-dependent protease ATPase subunit HslU [Aureibacillus halotolerans]TDQ39640.1 ATP-dependent HslUV protease ATP-binding subunit HslU [Aureibacillus halotolerans]
MQQSLTPRQIVEKLDQFIVGQKHAKKAVAVALRNRYRRSLVEETIREEIVPKNILMIGPTGVGKTEIARRLAKLIGAPFAKVEATKFTEVGYVGRDVESMVRDLVESAVRIVREEKVISVQDKALEQANQRIVDLLIPTKKQQQAYKNPLEMLFGQSASEDDEHDDDQQQEKMDKKQQRQQIEQKLLLGELEDHVITIELEEQQASMFDMLQGTGMEQMGMNMQDALGSMMPKKSKKKKLPVSEARPYLIQEEAQKLIDMDDVIQEAIQRVESMGMIFIDEIDKISGKGGHGGADVSREGVQRDILPIVEGSTVVTKHGPVKTDHILFIAAGAFHMSKPSDLIPELQGRFPIRVELSNLTEDDFYRILIEPDHALLRQYKALIQAEGINVEFSDDAIRKIASIAAKVNQETDNIGARRLHTILEKLLEDVLFEAPEITLETIEITPAYVDEKLSEIVKNRDLSQYIL